MKYWVIATMLALNTACSTTGNNQKESPASAETKTEAATEKAAEIPTEERAFIDAINQYDKKEIIAQFGEPAKADDVKVKGTNRIVASIWHYHYINTNAEGTYYETTELDFIGDKVVQVVFLNNDGSEPEVNGQSYDIPKQ